ncbi:magnesium transporter CorA family protein [Lapidilactobacillus achengensis]|uniref:Magnesium transporter CorA family protein n=1 Tax=Lapidilactobacillus achengensis TaxID=2486000 RepID=A0ABW1UPL0_9LACO|nr:magnesium transporter CorA family protein [Lapidilactobacillus achengensis]
MLRVGRKTKADNQIISVIAMTPQDRTELMDNYHLTGEFLRYATDPLERARVEFNSFTQNWLIVYNVPVAATEADRRVIHPVSFIIKDNLLFVFVTEQTKYVLSMTTDLNVGDQTKGVWDSIFSLLFEITTTYFDHIQRLTQVRAQIETHLRQRQRNNSKHIFELANLSTDLTYYLTGANGNLVAISQLSLAARRAANLQLSSISQSQLEDVEVEARQAQEMLELNSDIVDKLSNTYNNLLNNNLNQVMKLLTIYSVVLMIPPIIFGFYGMNMTLPLADKEWGWLFSILISIIPIGWVIYRLHRDHFI